MATKRERLEKRTRDKIAAAIAEIDKLKDELRLEFTKAEAAKELTHETMRLETKHAVLALIIRMLNNARDAINMS